MEKTIGNREIGIGPMWAEKTTWMISQVKKAMMVGRKVLVIRYSEDDRYSDMYVATHSGLLLKEADTKTMSAITDDDISDIVTNYDYVAIDEGQFFSDISGIVLKLSRAGCDVIVTCLSGDFKQNMFPEVCKLIPVVDKIHHFRAICMRCKRNKASYTIRIDMSNTEQKVIGGEDKYIVVCGTCLQ